MGIGNGRRLLVAAVVALGGAVVVGAMVSGPAQVGPPHWIPGRLPAPPPATAQPVSSLGPTDRRASQAWIGVAFDILVVIVVALIVLAILALVLRALQTRGVLRRSVPAPAAPGAASVAVEDAVAAPAVRRGIARALEILSEQREPRDAVVQAWLGLEDAAAASGLTRSPAQTPSEFAARVIRRFDTDRAAADALRRLYEEVRFGAAPVDAASVLSARDCLLRLQASWHAEATATAETSTR